MSIAETAHAVQDSVDALLAFLVRVRFHERPDDFAHHKFDALCDDVVDSIDALKEGRAFVREARKANPNDPRSGFARVTRLKAAGKPIPPNLREFDV